MLLFAHPHVLPNLYAVIMSEKKNILPLTRLKSRKRMQFKSVVAKNLLHMSRFVIINLMIQTGALHLIAVHTCTNVFLVIYLSYGSEVSN